MLSPSEPGPSNRLLPIECGEDLSCRVVRDSELLARSYADFGTDESKLAPGKVKSVAFPETFEQLRWAVKDAGDRGGPVTVASGRTGVVGGAVAAEGAHVVSLERYSGIEELGLDEEEGCHFLRVRGGTRLSEIDTYLSKNQPGLMYPVDPTERSAAAAGTAATNASGARSLRYGPTRSWVRALRVILPSGEVLDLRRGRVRAESGRFVLESSAGARALEAAGIPKPATKNTVGYVYGPEVDAVDLFVGSEGTLGVIADVEFRLAPRPAQRLFYLQFFANEGSAFDFIEGLRSASEPKPLAVEFMDWRSLELVSKTALVERNRYARMAREGACAAVFCELELDGEEHLERTVEVIEGLLEALGESMEHSGAGQEEVDLAEIKEFRHAMPEQVNLLIARRRAKDPAVHKLSTDMAVPPGELRWVYSLYRSRLEQAGLEHVIFGHAADGHLHVNVLARDRAEMERTMELYREFGREIARRGGAVAAEHGIGRIKKGFLELQYGPVHIEAMRTIKRFFDPNGVMSPGVLI